MPQPPPSTHQIRTIYRALLRRLPPLTTPATTTTTTPTPKSTSKISITPTHSFLRQNLTSGGKEAAQKVAQISEFLRAQRMYVELLGRYNPEVRGDEEDRVAMSAKRMGFVMPRQG
ncbi:hypothetical protein DFH27DRAFT_572622 [Peziza echinospora]|nr:hypothetical protein DFH27DRAFT_572622 [Peziza echinospora]